MRVSRRRVTFGPYGLDLDTGELRKGPTRIRLQDLPFRVLAALLERPGEVVSRQTLKAALWDQDTFVDFDHSLNTAVSKLRAALSDHAASPRYIETVGRRGYRFLGVIPEGAERDRPTETPARMSMAAPEPGAKPSIAVLPLANLSAAIENEFFSDGLTEEIINALASIPGLRVVARTSSFQFKNAAEDVRAIGLRLGVRYVLEGSVRRAGDRVRVAVQLIDVATGYHALSKMYERALEDIFVLQERLATEVAQELTPHLAVKVSGLPRTRSAEAYSKYLQARHHLLNRLNGLPDAAILFEEAIRLDPEYAAAYSGLADIRLTQIFFGILDPGLAWPEAKAAAAEALRLDEKLAQAHVSVALVEIGLDWAWEKGADRLAHARSLSPDDPFLTVVYAFWGLARRGEYRRALETVEPAVRSDPFNPMIHASIILNLGLLGRYDEAMAHYRLTTEITREYAVSRTMAQVHHFVGEHEAALETLLSAGTVDRIPGSGAHDAYGDFAFAYGITGRKAEAEAVAAMMKQRAEHAYLSPWNWALYYAGRGRKEQAVQALRRLVNEKSLKVGAFSIEPRLNGLRGERSFEQLLQEVRLAPS